MTIQDYAAQRDIAVVAVDATVHEDELHPVKNKRRFRPSLLVLHIVVTIGAILMGLPFVWMLASAFKPLEEIFTDSPKLLPMAPTMQNFETAFSTGNFYSALLNSVYIATLVTAISVLTSAMAAYVFARMKFPGSGVIFAVFLATMMVPSQLTIIPLYIIMGWFGWVDTHLALIVPPALFSAFGVFMLRQYVRGIPLELEEAAALLRTPMVALGIFTFLGQWNNFFGPLIFLNTSELFTLPLWVNQFKGQYASDWGGLMAATSLVALPFLILFIFAQKQIGEGIALQGSKT